MLLTALPCTLLHLGAHLLSYMLLTWANAPNPAMLAFQAVCLLSCCYFGIAGTVLWVQADSTDRLYGYSAGAQQLAEMMVAFQLWDAAVSLCIKKLRVPEMIGHHLVTALLSYFVTAPFVHYYAIFFLGAAELSNVALTGVDIFKNVPAWRSRFPNLNALCRYSFALLFLLLRVIAWPVVSFWFWTDAIQLLLSGKAHSTVVVLIFLLANCFLTGLQVIWANKLIRFVANTYKKGKTDHKTQAKSREAAAA